MFLVETHLHRSYFLNISLFLVVSGVAASNHNGVWVMLTSSHRYQLPLLPSYHISLPLTPVPFPYQADNSHVVAYAPSSLLGIPPYVPPGQVTALHPFVMHQQGVPHPSHVMQSHFHSVAAMPTIQNWPQVNAQLFWYYLVQELQPLVNWGCSL